MRLLDRTLSVELSPIAAAYAHLARRTSTKQLLDLSQAAPSYPTADIIADRIAEVAHSADGGRYAPSPGLPDLRAALADELNTDHQVSAPRQTLSSEVGANNPLSANNVQITAGCNQAFCAIATTLAEPGDEFIVPVPYYFNHDMWLKLEGIVPRYLFSGDDQLPDPAKAASLINDKTRAIVLVSPANPTGAIVPPATIDAFFELAERHNLALILDETYRNFRGTDEPSHQLYSRPNWDQTLVTLHSFSKDLAIPGYRVGAIVGSEALTAEALKVLDCVAICAPRVGQEAALAGLQLAGDWRRAQAERIGARLQIFRSTMEGQPGGFELMASGAFFGWVRHPFTDDAAPSVVERLVLEHDLLVIPGTAFTPTDDHWLRFSFANLEPDDFPLLAERLEHAAATW
ncbi:MAG: aspartate/methionine/tyrosine aminotransferase [Acidimicrobiales bacterium]|jgi:aspartate/methionine/tyrosine aminotransferase